MGVDRSGGTVTTLVTLDAGTRHAGLAVFAGGYLVAAYDLCTSVASPAAMLDEVTAVLPPRDILATAHLLSEWPQNYARKRAAHEDLDGLRRVVALVEGTWTWGATRRVTPAAWKGQVPKRIHWVRAAEALNPWERDVWNGVRVDGRDAVALGLWALRRLTGPRG